MADENNSDLEDGEILDSESDGEVVDQSDQAKTCATHTQNERESRTMKRVRDSFAEDGYRDHSSSPPAKKLKLNVAHDAAASSGGESGSENNGKDSSSEHEESGDEGLDEDSSFKYRSRGSASSFKAAAPFGIQARPSMSYPPPRHYVKKPLLSLNVGKEEEDEDDFDRQLSRERQRQMEMSQRNRSRDDHGSRRDDFHHGDNDGYSYGMRDSEDDYRGYHGDYGRGRSSSRHDYSRDVEESESSWSHGRDHSSKEGSRHRGSALPSLMPSSRRPDVAVAAAEGDNSAFTDGRRSERGERSTSRSIRREQKAKDYVERSRQWEQEKGQRKNVRSSIPCKFYNEGRCNKGSDCPFSHDGKPKRKRELCKFYSADACSRGDDCLYMHEEFPCKFHHTGNYCFSGSACRFSHEPLTDETRCLLDKVLEPSRNAVDFTSDETTTEAAFSSDSFSLPESHSLPQRSGLIAVPTLYHSVEDDYIEERENDEEEEELRIEELLAEEDAHHQQLETAKEEAGSKAVENEPLPEEEEQEIFIYRPFGEGADPESSPDKEVVLSRPPNPLDDSDVEEDAPLMIDVGTPTDENPPDSLSFDARRKEDPLLSPEHVPFGIGQHKATRPRLPALPPVPKGDLADQTHLSAEVKDALKQPLPSSLPGNASPQRNVFATRPLGYSSPHHSVADEQGVQTSDQATSAQLSSQPNALNLAAELSSGNSSDFTRQHLTLLKRFVAAVESKFSEKERQAATNPSSADVDMRHLLEEAAQQLKMDTGETASPATNASSASSSSAWPDDPRRHGQDGVTGVHAQSVSETHPPQPVAMYLNDGGRSSPLHLSQQSQPVDPRVARRMASMAGSQSPSQSVHTSSTVHATAEISKSGNTDGQSWSATPNLGLGAVPDAASANRDPRRRPTMTEPSAVTSTSAQGGRKGLLPTPPAHLRLPVGSDADLDVDNTSVVKDRRSTADPRGGDRPRRETADQSDYRSNPRSSSREAADQRGDYRSDPRSLSREADQRGDYRSDLRSSSREADQRGDYRSDPRSSSREADFRSDYRSDPRSSREADQRSDYRLDLRSSSREVADQRSDYRSDPRSSLREAADPRSDYRSDVRSSREAPDPRSDYRSDPRSSLRSDYRDSRADSVRDSHVDRYDPRSASRSEHRSEHRSSETRSMRSEGQSGPRADRQATLDEAHSGHSLGPRSSNTLRHVGSYGLDVRGSGSQDVQSARHDPRQSPRRLDTSSEMSTADQQSAHLAESWPSASYRKSAVAESGQESLSWSGSHRSLSDPRFGTDQRSLNIDQKLKGWHADTFRNADPTASPFG